MDLSAPLPVLHWDKLSTKAIELSHPGMSPPCVCESMCMRICVSNADSLVQGVIRWG